MTLSATKSVNGLQLALAEMDDRNFRPMQVKDIKLRNCVFCMPDTNLQRVAQLMLENCCSAVAVVENEETLKPVGIVSDRDICCRIIARGQNPVEFSACACLSPGLVTIDGEASIEACCALMEAQQVRWVLVLDKAGGCCGMVTLADIADHASDPVIAGAVKALAHTHAHQT
jgi:CBS domain-containing protein